ncbi:dihydroxyacetone kinase subunit L [Methylophaga sp. 42_25_T18]|nr:dihydroxyacetone kinase subunit L [Methylophaga sp. 42_25_T18]OUR89109.1 dihydroxyacetone kinase subunit L [Methylophaga sp. 42_8_T64]
MSLLPDFITAIQQTIHTHEIEVTELDKAIGDGDHVVNLQRGLAALKTIENELASLDYSSAFMKIGMTLMSTMGGASGSLFGTLFISMAKATKDQPVNLTSFAAVFAQGVESVKQRGKADLGEKTMLDTLIPVVNSLQESAQNNESLSATLEKLKLVAIKGMESTEGMIATKGRASFLGERAIGHIDAGARTSQLMICAIADVLLAQQ